MERQKKDRQTVVGFSSLVVKVQDQQSEGCRFKPHLCQFWGVLEKVL